MKTYALHLMIAFLGVAAVALSAAAQESLDRTKRPPPQGVPNVRLPAIQKGHLTNGLEVWLVEKHELPLITLSLVIQAGSDHDPLDRPGVATMTAEMMDAGTTSLDALQISEKLSYLGASMMFRANLDGTTAVLSTLTKHLEEALGVFADVIASPTFPQKEFQRIQKQRLTTLIQQKDRAATIATLAFDHIIYGPAHPYGNDAAGSEQSLNAMTREDLEKFYSTYYRPNNATLVVVGDVILKDVTALLERGLAQWKPASVPSLPIPPAPSISRRSVYLIDKPGAPQSEIRIGYPALARNTADYFPVMVMNRLLGGQFSSRLNLNLREKRGLTYGAPSVFSFNKQPGPFVASAGVTSVKTDTALHEFLFEIDRMFKEGVTPDELEFSKKGLAGNFALNFETPAQVSGALVNLVLYGLPDNYYATYLSNINNVTVDEIRKVSAKYLDSSKMAIVIVGDIKVIKGGVQSLKAGETVMCNVEGNPL